MDVDFDTGNSRYKARERYSSGSQILSNFGSPGASLEALVAPFVFYNIDLSRQSHGATDLAQDRDTHGYYHFSGPIKAGTIKDTTGTTVGDVANVGSVVMAQSAVLDIIGADALNQQQRLSLLILRS